MRSRILGDFSKFPSLADRLQQGIVNTLYLGRLLAHPQGFAANAAFQGPAGRRCSTRRTSTSTPTRQGAILGGLATAIAPDWTRAVLGVATMDYGSLLPRSVDFDTYVAPRAGLPGRGHAPADHLARPDAVGSRRDERLGLPRHAEPADEHAQHTVLLHVAVGDHQVANAMSDVEARTIGARAYRPAIAPGARSTRRRCSGSRRSSGFPFPRLGDRLLGRRAADAARADGQHPQPRRADPHSSRATPSPRASRSPRSCRPTAR